MALKVDMVKLDQMLQNLKNYVEALREAGTLPLETYLQGRRTRISSRYDLQASVQSCIDIANFLIAEKNWRQPDSAFDAFCVLAEEGVLPQSFLPTLEAMVKTRNLIVHIYAHVDDARIYGIIQENLGGFGRFTQHVLDYVRAQGALDATGED